MTKRHIKEWSEINQIVPKLPDDKRQILYQELKRSGQVENPINYTETHLEGGDADDEYRRTDRQTGKPDLE
ncbi:MULTISPECIES: hypothetical protein [unclassified Pelosinus]|jgi:hypothetical protein|uniref:hypothetical protein n=1 Tax=unclassified Pelosinus TaxID=2629460 RepID=UPI0004D1EAE7|nr:MULTISPECIES: hypothetical protein [unclassified Pelosinus]AIF52328.1 hypothetical protein UFO1_2785 [Pelosinus sp. UFO1]GMB00750.1 hypothetical protein PIPA1_35490 [Pelosinus sp. IPA-1]